MALSYKATVSVLMLTCFVETAHRTIMIGLVLMLASMRRILGSAFYDLMHIAIGFGQMSAIRHRLIFIET